MPRIVLAFATLIGFSSIASASHCGLCRWPAPCVAASQCCPVPATTVQYQPVTEERCEVRYRPATRTCMQAQTFTCSRPVYETQMEAQCYTVNRSVCEPVDRMECYTVNRPCYE